MEFRLLGIRTMGEANSALPGLIARHNKRYSVQPIEAESAYMPLDPQIQQEHVFALRETRKVNSGGAIRYKNVSYITEYPQDTFAPRSIVEVREPRSLHCLCVAGVGRDVG